MRQAEAGGILKCLGQSDQPDQILKLSEMLSQMWEAIEEDFQCWSVASTCTGILHTCTWIHPHTHAHTHTHEACLKCITQVAQFESFWWKRYMRQQSHRTPMGLEVYLMLIYGVHYTKYRLAITFFQTKLDEQQQSKIRCRPFSADGVVLATRTLALQVPCQDFIYLKTVRWRGTLV